MTMVALGTSVLGLADVAWTDDADAVVTVRGRLACRARENMV